MGGIGSGRQFYLGCKETTARYISLDIRYLKREGLLQAGYAGTMRWRRGERETGSIGLSYNGETVNLRYTHTNRSGAKEDKCYPVFLEWTACHLAGKRPWFLCPHCCKRVAILYGADIFVCRHCLNLNYASQREQPFDRLAGKAQRIREKLGWTCGILNGHEGKPKGMHWKTYFKLIDEHDRALRQSVDMLGGKLARQIYLGEP